MSGQLLIYNDKGEDVASCVVEGYGDRWRMRAIRGDGFSAAWPEMIEVLRDKGMRKLEGYVTPPHARLVRASLRHEPTVNITIEPPVWQADIDKQMCWVVVTLTDINEDND